MDYKAPWLGDGSILWRCKRVAADRHLRLKRLGLDRASADDRIRKMATSDRDDRGEVEKPPPDGSDDGLASLDYEGPDFAQRRRKAPISGIISLAAIPFQLLWAASCFFLALRGDFGDAVGRNGFRNCLAC